MKDSHSSRLDSRLAFLSLGLRLLTRIALTLLLLQVIATVSLGTPLNEYRKRLESAASALDTVGQFDESESEANHAIRVSQTIASVRAAVPETENVEYDGAVYRVDNSWLHRELQTFEKGDPALRSLTLKRITERLHAVAERMADLEDATRVSAASKTEARQKLTQILQRQEYAGNRPQTSAFAVLLERFIKWFQSLFPKPKPLAPGRANLLTLIAQIAVVLLALGVIAYAIRMFAPRFFRGRRSRKKEKAGPRIVLGEKLQPDQSAVDLLAEAEALAQRGELRAAIRKAYIALLVELGDRNVISLAQHKTNRDYLAAIRDHVSLYGCVKQLTDSFERHWYGFAKATDADWSTFRAGYKQALIQ